MRQQGSLLIPAVPMSQSRRRRVCIGALLASALLSVADDVSAQGTRNSQPLNLGANQQTPDGKWYSKYVPWNKSSDPAKMKAPKKRQITNVEEPSEQVKSDGQLSFARLAERRGQPEQAKAVYEAFVNRQSDNPLPYHRLGVMAAREGNFELCDSYLAKAFHLDGNNPELLTDIGYSMYLRGLNADAETFYRRALELDRDHEAAANNLAMLLAETGRHTESLALFRRVNDEAKAYSNQGYVLAQTGDLEGAKKYFNHALTLDTTLKQAATGMLQVAEYQKQLRTTPDFIRESAPEQLAATSSTSSRQPPEAVAKPAVSTPEASSMVVVQDRERPLAAARMSPTPLLPVSPPMGAVNQAESWPPLAMIADRTPAAVADAAQSTMNNQRAQDLSVRNASKPKATMNAHRPQVIGPTKEDADPPRVLVQTQTPDRRSSQVTAVSQALPGRTEPKVDPAGSVFATRVSDIAEPAKPAPKQTVPESSLPTVQTSARTPWRANPVRPATLSVESQQLVPPVVVDTSDWASQPHSNLALQSILPAARFHSQPTTTLASPPAENNSVKEPKLLRSVTADRQ